jgi:disulfide bond formation protein DsbB
MPYSIADQLHSPAVRAGLLAFIGATAVILSALAFEHLGGYIPCPLCLQQRYAYYFAIPALLAAVALIPAEQHTAARVLFAVVAIAFIVNAGLGVYQAGAEWNFWDPPASCAAPSTLPTFDLKRDSFDRVPVSCGVASWRFLGLSFAGWNVVASLLLAAAATLAALTTPRAPLAVHGASR